MLTDLAFPDAVLEHLQQSQSDLIAPMSRGQQHAFIARRIIKAKELELDSMSDILAYCVLALVKGEDFVDQMTPEDKIAALTTSTEGMTA